MTRLTRRGWTVNKGCNRVDNGKAGQDLRVEKTSRKVINIDKTRLRRRFRLEKNLAQG